MKYDQQFVKLDNLYSRNRRPSHLTELYYQNTDLSRQLRVHLRILDQTYLPMAYTEGPLG
ncbi:hypothetical protein D3C72_1225010 [compost metagenome]